MTAIKRLTIHVEYNEGTDPVQVQYMVEAVALHAYRVESGEAPSLRAPVHVRWQTATVPQFTDEAVIRLAGMLIAHAGADSGQETWDAYLLDALQILEANPHLAHDSERTDLK